MRSADDVAEDALGPLEDAIASVDLVRALLWLVTAVIIGAVVFLSALERQRDFAILRAMGTPRRALLLAVAVPGGAHRARSPPSSRSCCSG